MNAAARVINQGNLFNGQLANMHMSKSFYFLMILLISVLISGFAVIYSTNTYRSVFAQVEQEEQQSHFLQLQWGQLLLEQASLATPARVEELAIEKLKMTFPTSKNTYLLHAQFN
ncbi:cell division protein FtsL [Legionella fallonii]|uniref:Cell division protein FtsL n=1 Tax=Legionella fallonii LLAP-10 TaxID=1212491 RepID=A0A098G365_9GAMM|nr:cell division protein FtsL [Legionella fallonii]CEG56426.1 Cell division protein FtsL [Legionella fallonii LLAP-10]